MTPYTDEERKAACLLIDVYLDDDNEVYTDRNHGYSSWVVDMQCALTRAEEELERLRERESRLYAVITLAIESEQGSDRPNVDNIALAMRKWLSEPATEPEEGR